MEKDGVLKNSTHDTPARLGVKGVRLKKFEEVVADILKQVSRKPSFVKLPIPSGCSSEWPFDLLPKAAGIQDLEGKRAERKEAQLRSLMRCVVMLIPTHNGTCDPIRIVDFGGGTGHLAIPLALWLSSQEIRAQVIVVDLKATSLNKLHEKAYGTQETCAREKDLPPFEPPYDASEHVTIHQEKVMKTASINNLYTYHGSIASFNEPFNIGISLHACGEASDWVLRKCGRTPSCYSFVIAPCCVGKLNRNVKDPYIYRATAANEPTISYPQSQMYCSVIDAEQFNFLSKAADYGDDVHNSRNATRRAAKSLLEHDRLLYMEQEYNFQTALTRMEPWECTPKHDILIGWRGEGNVKVMTEPCGKSSKDLDLSINHLLSSETTGVEWSREEEHETRQLIQGFVDGEETLAKWRMSSRRRKLVHFLAVHMDLLHWSEGKGTKKVVVVAKRKSKRVEELC